MERKKKIILASIIASVSGVVILVIGLVVGLGQSTEDKPVGDNDNELPPDSYLAIGMEESGTAAQYGSVPVSPKICRIIDPDNALLNLNEIEKESEDPGSKDAPGQCEAGQGVDTEEPAPVDKGPEGRAPTPPKTAQPPNNVPRTPVQAPSTSCSQPKAAPPKKEAVPEPPQEQPQATAQPASGLILAQRTRPYKLKEDDPAYENRMPEVFKPRESDYADDRSDNFMVKYDHLYDVEKDKMVFRKTFGISATEEDIPLFERTKASFIFLPEGGEPMDDLMLNQVKDGEKGRLSGTRLHINSELFKIVNKFEVTSELEINDSRIIEGNEYAYLVLYFERIHGLYLLSLIGTDIEDYSRKYISFVLETAEARADEVHQFKVNTNYLDTICKIANTTFGAAI